MKEHKAFPQNSSSSRASDKRQENVSGPAIEVCLCSAFSVSLAHARFRFVFDFEESDLSAEDTGKYRQERQCNLDPALSQLCDNMLAQRIGHRKIQFCCSCLHGTLIQGAHENTEADQQVELEKSTGMGYKPGIPVAPA
ncbi:unnamed protein product [Sphagnum jensenii]|uniref:Uncharacterized protein n=1 Tax=Sphagnum jensenii TaxID=128206 RepID=A0ABP1APD4_9BRYO